MSSTKESREETMKRLSERASALEARTRTEAVATAEAQKVVGQAWRIVAELIGGVFIGLGLGVAVDYFFDTAPIGVIGGVLVGFALSFFMARNTAKRLMAEAKALGETPAGEPVVEVNEDEER
ncbi:MULTISPECIES: AtpZ/AtpI family protein [unclassified Brevundimonas]|uniref:AtpZ/AtpI family protein n=1 Tax=unclassified Brevundimonas TaxID=2622653 RepID=UPI0025C247DE|nr:MULTISPECIES: AtpZ/AtpI family protein [unclassified Brevundimonas]